MPDMGGKSRCAKDFAESVYSRMAPAITVIFSQSQGLDTFEKVN
jgi:hypothetical protein